MPTFTLHNILSLLASATLAVAAPVTDAPAATAAATPCTTGRPVTTAGYTISYAPVIPTIAFDAGYKPNSAWSESHAVGTYTFGAPEPIESGFAYSQFKCQFYCNNQPGAGSFFVNLIDDKVGAACTCFDGLLEPDSFVSNNQTRVGAWNHICA